MNSIVTLQFAMEPSVRVRHRIVRMFCPDAIHLAAIARGLECCEECGKILPKPSLKKCEHGVYVPALGFEYCSVCRPTVSPGALRREIQLLDEESKQYTSVLISDADLTLRKIRKKKHGNFDRHQFEKHYDAEIGFLSEMFEHDPDASASPGYTIGLLRGGKIIAARNDTPQWILSDRLLTEFSQQQKNTSRVREMLFLFYRCGVSDREIAARFEISEEAAKKWRQRLIRDAEVYFEGEAQAG